MGIKGHQNAGSPGLPRPAVDFSQHCLMAEVHAVE
jgi:hypothetical protein